MKPAPGVRKRKGKLDKIRTVGSDNRDIREFLIGKQSGGVIRAIRGIKCKEPGGGEDPDSLLDQGHLNLDLDRKRTPEEDFESSPTRRQYCCELK